MKTSVMCCRRQAWFRYLRRSCRPILWRMSPRRSCLYISASSGKSVGDGRVSASRPAEESAELVTGGVEGRLLIFAAVIEQRSAVFDHLRKDSVHGFLSQGRIVMKIADELPAQRPHIIDVSLNRFRREFRCGERFKERSTAPAVVHRAADLFPAPSMSGASRRDPGNSVRCRGGARWWRGLFWKFALSSSSASCSRSSQF